MWVPLVPLVGSVAALRAGAGGRPTAVHMETRHAMPPLLLFSPASSELTEQLGSLRCAVFIARALGAELLLPRWRCGQAWVASDVADATSLATLVPLVSGQVFNQ